MGFDACNLQVVAQSNFLLRLAIERGGGDAGLTCAGKFFML
jgi:hypothetical protein